jgi:acyl-CoA thioester hydrolase
MGVVYHANYLVWMEMGRVELVRSRGFNYKDLEEEGYLLSVVETHCRYLCPARYDQEIVVETEIAKSNPRLVEFAYHIRSKGPDKLLATGTTRHVWLNRDWRPISLPERFREVLQVG